MLSIVRTAVRRVPSIQGSVIVRSFSAHAESDADFNKRWVEFFKTAEDGSELRRGLQNVFSHDLVPVPEIIESALRCARRFDDYPSAVRVIEGLKFKLLDDNIYKQYLAELKPVLDELGVEPRESIGI